MAWGKVWLYIQIIELMVPVVFLTMKIKCLSLNPSLSRNYLGDEGLLQLFRCLPKLKMLRSLE